MKNGHRSELPLATIKGVGKFSSANTCAFDSLTTVFLNACDENPLVLDYFKNQRTENEYFDFMCLMLEKKFNTSFHSKRTQIIYKMCDPVVRNLPALNIFNIDCGTVLSKLYTQLFLLKNFLSVLSKDLFANSVDFEIDSERPYLFLEILQTSDVSSSPTHEEYDENESFDLKNYYVECALEDIPNEIKIANKTFKLRGIIALAPSSNAKTKTSLHFIAYCKRQLAHEWYEAYDDLKNKMYKVKKNIKGEDRLRIVCIVNTKEAIL